MRYYLVHMTSHEWGFAKKTVYDVLVKGDSDNIELKAGKRDRDWLLGSGWFEDHVNIGDMIKEAVKNGTHEWPRPKGVITYKARELTDEEAAMILFQGRKAVS